MSILEEVKETLKHAIEGAEVEVLDPMNDQTHLEAIVVCDIFEGKSLVERHRMVMLPLQEHFKTTLHALKLKTYTKEQYDNRKHP